jgi:diadenosine tetraphosphatase ApaH/serine/threonine PP2A family protein phosphatase
MSSRTAVLSDIHSNLEALTAVLADVEAQGVEKIICLGDIVGYASGVRACLRKIRSLGCPVILGNHDEAACLPDVPSDFNPTARVGALFSAQRLQDEDKEWIRSLPRRLEIDGAEYFHASLESLMHWPYIANEWDAKRHFVHQSTPLAFCGHTHYPVAWFQATLHGAVIGSDGCGNKFLPSNGKILVNVGSVGQPRDGDPRACYVIHDPNARTVEFRRIPYDVRRAKKKGSFLD